MSTNEIEPRGRFDSEPKSIDAKPTTIAGDAAKVVNQMSKKP